MTLTRTIHRRNARKRARAEALAAQRRWEALSPEQRADELAMRETMRRRVAVINNAFYEIFLEARRDEAFISGDRWPQSVIDARK